MEGWKRGAKREVAARISGSLARSLALASRETMFSLFLGDSAGV